MTTKPDGYMHPTAHECISKDPNAYTDAIPLFAGKSHATANVQAEEVPAHPVQGDAEFPPLHDNLRDLIGQAISDGIQSHVDDCKGDDTKPDWFDSRNIDIIADAVLKVVLQSPASVDAQRDAETVEPEQVWSVDGETFRENFCEVIDSLNIGDTIHEGYSNRPELSEFISADSVIDDITNSAYDNFGEYADDWCDDMSKVAKDKDAMQDLESLMEAWLRKHAPAITFFTVKNITSRTLTADDYGNDDAAQAALKDKT